MNSQKGVIVRQLFIRLTILLVFIFGIRTAHAQLQAEQLTLTTLDGLEIAVHRIVNGNDRVLIYCHRLLSSGSSFDLNGFGKVFLQEFDVITFDFRGHGKAA